MTHHSDEHVDEDDDDGHVVEGEEKHADSLDNRRGVVSSGEAIGIQSPFLLQRILYLDAFDTHQAKHRPEQTVQRTR